MSLSRNRLAGVSLALAIAILGCSVPGCQEETYKVSRGTNELPKVKDPKAAERIEKVNKAEQEIFAKSAKLR